MARKTTFPQAVTEYRVSDGAGYIATVRAKDFPDAGDHGEFRVYTVFGDVTKPQALETALHNLMTDHGVERRKIIINL